MNVSDNIQDTVEKEIEKNEGEKARPLPHSYSYIQTSAESESILSKLPLSKQA